MQCGVKIRSINFLSLFYDESNSAFHVIPARLGFVHFPCFQIDFVNVSFLMSSVCDIDVRFKAFQPSKWHFIVDVNLIIGAGLCVLMINPSKARYCVRLVHKSRSEVF